MAFLPQVESTEVDSFPRINPSNGGQLVPESAKNGIDC
ncbi:hypothetical protein RISK_004091 [Rhodopirellula islandica]|uniref:Uncharacterized protein n=1 Tax=Rhodopirellula islandica TaxID=595434 RepID=A0A0J1EDR1_RHOIS|nr:hypothetical protein RISK_004091 [Rhodopirellula islandica]